MWKIILCIGFLCLILEMFTPTMFFLNFAIAAFVCAGLSFFIKSIPVLVVIFCVLSVILIYTVRPVLKKLIKKDKATDTGLESKYIGQKASVIEDVDKEKGVISIYDERWQARNVEDGVIEKGSTVEIVSNESIVMNVRKV